MIQEKKIPYKMWLSPRTASRMVVAFGNLETGDIRHGTLTKIADIAISGFLKQAAEKLIEKEINTMEEGSHEWWNEMRRLAAADLLEEAQLSLLVDKLREGRKTVVGGDKKTKKKSEVTTIPLDELEAML